MAKITPRKRDKLMRKGLNKIRAQHVKTASRSVDLRDCFACFEAVKRLNNNVADGRPFRF